VEEAALRLLRRWGTRPVLAPGQTCCGAIHQHTGDLEGARRLARRNVLAFEPWSRAPVVVEAAGCGAMLKGYGELLSDDPLYAARARAFSRRVQDLSEFLLERLPAGGASLRPAGALPSEAPVLHVPCHLLHVQGLSHAPAELLGRLGLPFRPAPEPEVCCGSGGIANLLEPHLGRELGRHKAQRLLETGARLVLTSNPGCLFQLRRHLPIPVRHVAEHLDQALGGAGEEGGGG
jgi:glycolate oxidase iron-sulfur subunit